jgi:hypothetical protein
MGVCLSKDQRYAQQSAEHKTAWAQSTPLAPPSNGGDGGSGGGELPTPAPTAEPGTTAHPAGQDAQSAAAARTTASEAYDAYRPVQAGHAPARDAYDAYTAVPSASDAGSGGRAVPGLLRPRLIARSELTILRELGKGAFGIVSEALLRGERVAVKQLDLAYVRRTLGFDEAAVIEAFYWEAVNLALTDHPSIVALRGVCVEGNYRAVVLEFCPGGDMRSPRRAPASTVWRWALQLAEALRYLHANGQVCVCVRPNARSAQCSAQC